MGWGGRGKVQLVLQVLLILLLPLQANIFPEADSQLPVAQDRQQRLRGGHAGEGTRGRDLQVPRDAQEAAGLCQDTGCLKTASHESGKLPNPRKGGPEIPFIL